MSIADQKVVQNQYADSTRLATRISIHEKYSRNKQPFGDWIVSHYHLEPGERVLEVGCGTGSMWQYAVIPDGCHVTLTDLSPGMLDTARRCTAHMPADYAVCDVTELPYPDDAFDVVIANMMLYHVPYIERALAELRRVLKPQGRFFAATSGEHGVTEAVLNLLGLPCTANHRFTLQNGGEQLAKHFACISMVQRPDALDITNPADLIAYLRSMAGMTVLADIPDEQLAAVFRAHMKDGVLSLPKEYGLFICSGTR